MNRLLRFFPLLWILISIIFFSGCTAIVRPVISEAEFLSTNTKKIGRADLYVTEEFKIHTEIKTDFMDLKKWEFELGAVSIDAFKYALSNSFEKVDVKLGSPTFKPEENINKDLIVVVEPAFSGFKSHCPIVFKFETYKVIITFKVKAYDKTGKILLDRVYRGIGEKRGSIGYESAGHAANPIAAQLAIKNAVDQAVKDILSVISK